MNWLFPVLLLFLTAPQLTTAQTKLEKLSDQSDQWWLPDYLNEASGIAVIGDRGILLHDDELPVIYHVSLDDYTIEKFGTLNDVNADIDFEGVALNGSTIYLITSAGLIYQSVIDPKARHQELESTIIDTGLENICEIEGLHYYAGTLLIPCKESRESRYQGKLVIFGFDIQNKQIREHLVLDKKVIGDIEGPSPTAIDMNKNNYFVVSTNILLRIHRKTREVDTLCCPNIGTSSRRESQPWPTVHL